MRTSTSITSTTMISTAVNRLATIPTITPSLTPEACGETAPVVIDIGLVDVLSVSLIVWESVIDGAFVMTWGVVVVGASVTLGGSSVAVGSSVVVGGSVGSVAVGGSVGSVAVGGSVGSVVVGGSVDSVAVGGSVVVGEVVGCVGEELTIVWGINVWGTISVGGWETGGSGVGEGVGTDGMMVV